MIQLLLEKYKPNAGYHLEGSPTLLHQAAADPLADIQIMDLLLNYGADVNAALENCVTPLTYALSARHCVDVHSIPQYVIGFQLPLLYGDRVSCLLDHGARVADISYCHLCDPKNSSLGEFVDILSPQKSKLACRGHSRLLPIMKRLLVFWKKGNLQKAREDAIKELGGEVVWEDYENINLDSSNVLKEWPISL